MATEQDSNTLEQILAKLITFHTVSGDYEAAKECLDYSEAYLAKRGMGVERLEFNGFPALVATTLQTKTPKVLLQSHVDVVHAPDSFFQLTEKDGKLFGRGVFDMKFAAAIFLKVADELRDELGNYDFGIMLTTDEEIGGSNGVKALLDTGYGGEVCILPDAGDMWNIETSHKGSWRGKICAKGKTAHGSRPWEGENAIERLIDALAEMRILFEGQHIETDTLSINKIEGGKMLNQVADKAEACFDIRFISDVSYHDLREKVETIAGSMGVEIETLGEVLIAKTDVNHPLVASFLNIAAEIHGKPLGQIRSLGTSDFCHFFKRNIPTIQARPDGGGAHSDNEWIDKDGFEKYYEVVKAYLEKEAKV